MKFLNYLNEEIDEEEIASLIKKDCQPFLTDWKKLKTSSFLYTGKQASIKDISKKQVRKDRKPLDTPEDLHTIVDDWFYKKFGIRARSNAVFTSFKTDVSIQYGKPYLVFPIGKYTAITSSKIPDLYVYFLRRQSDLYHYYNSGDSFLDPYKDDTKKEVIDILEKANYRKGLRHNASEIMINCKEYYLVDDVYKYVLQGLLK